MQWKNRPEGSNWGDFGPDDQLGRPNAITPAQVLKGASEIRAGLSFCLSLPLDYPGGNKLNVRRHPPVLQPTAKEGTPYVNFPFSRLQPGATDIVSDDQVLMCLQYSTQWDALAHVGAVFDADGDGVAEHVYYNGFMPNRDIVGPLDYCCNPECEAAPTGATHSNAKALGVENLALKGMQGRGVLVDFTAHFGRAYRTFGYDDLMRVIHDDGISIEPGDMLLLRTGFAEMVLEMRGEPDLDILNSHCGALDGRDTRLLQWLTDSGITALAADNYAVERMPARAAKAAKAPMMPLHHHCIFKLGMPLGELWYLQELATWLRANRRSHFLLTAPPLRLPGAMGSPVTPIATV
jgi:kynurenine formamidase